MSTIRNANTTGGGMYAPSQGINTALTNPNGITSASYSDGSGFSGNAEHFSTGNPFKPVPQGYTPYNPALGPSQQPLPTAPPPTAPNSAAPAVPGPIGASAPVLNPAPGAPGATGVFGEALPDDPNQAYAQLCSFGVPPAEAAKAVISGRPPQRGGQYDTTSNPRQQTGGGLGPNLATGPSYQPTGPSPFDQYAAQMPPNPFGNNNFFGGGYGYGQGSNVSMLQALMGGGGGGYGDFLSQLLSRNYGG